MADTVFPIDSRSDAAQKSRPGEVRGGQGLPDARRVTAVADGAPEALSGRVPGPASAPSNLITLPSAGVQVPPVIGDVMAYWGRLRLGAEGGIPARAAVDPKEIGAHLGQVFIAALTTPRVARLRIVGAGISDLMGLDPRGMALCALFAQPARQELRDAFAQVASGARVLLPLQSEPLPGQPRLTAVMALMPLRAADGAVTQILGVIGVNGTPGAFPRKLGLASTRIVAGGTHRPADTPTGLASVPSEAPRAALNAQPATPRPQLVRPAPMAGTGAHDRTFIPADLIVDTAKSAAVAPTARTNAAHLTLIFGGKV
ncbi:PAS domain-containing protein [Roseicitreum antarcticum]|uniref:PAS domain-containing protein n=1 Tax=Roseicitreum antarcticum TaxID=564137 RepID=A0A1H3C7L2_9RHOB|nr:PAS domain-containing protein [Roseicitreum antarcticum]SDX50091.1 hypothetical protein SAMN04488238_10956 [Roseicitreum antarcticum]